MLRILVSVFLILMIVEGAIRKWILPDYDAEVFVLKDVVLAFAFIAYALQSRPNKSTWSNFTPWYLWLAFSLGYAVLSGLSFENLVGLRYYLAPLPLIFLVPALISNSDELERVAAWAVRLTFPIGILAVIQYFSPLDSPINAYAWGGQNPISSFGIEEGDLFGGISRARVTATFSYISTFAAFLSATWILAWLSVLHGRSQLDRWLAGVALILIIFNMGMNGSRALLLVAAVSGLPFALTLIRQLGTFRSQILVAGFAIAFGYLGISIFEPFALTAERGDTEESVGRITDMLVTPITTFSEISWVGSGIGSTFGGFEQLGYRAGEGFNEVTVDRVGVELGVMGYFIVLTLKVMMLAKAIGVYRRAPTSELRHWALAALLVQMSANWQIPFYNAMAAVYYFCAIGLVYWLEGETKRRRAASPSALGWPSARTPAVRGGGR